MNDSDQLFCVADAVSANRPSAARPLIPAAPPASGSIPSDSVPLCPSKRKFQCLPTLLSPGAATMGTDLQRPRPLHLGFSDPSSLGWPQQPGRRIRSVHGRSTSGSADHGQRPDGGVAGTGAACCPPLRSLHVSSCASGGQTPLPLRPRGTPIVGGFYISQVTQCTATPGQHPVSVECTAAAQAKSYDKSQLDEGIHSKHISNLLCLGSFFCSEFVLGASFLLSTWI